MNRQNKLNNQISTIVILVIGFAFASSATAKEIMPMFGGVLIDGYDLRKDPGPTGGNFGSYLKELPKPSR